MNVDKLEKLLKELTGQDDVKPFLKIIAHWTKKIKSSENKLSTNDQKEMESLQKISELLIITIDSESDSEINVSLTEEGKELSDDFFKKGFYL